MKTLDQIEPRRPLVAGTAGVQIGSTRGVAITAAGSYYLTGHLSVASGDGITISASSVSVDLCGYTVTSEASTPSGSAIVVGDNLNQVAVRNGFIAGGSRYTGNAFVPGPGFASGVVAPLAGFVVVEDVGVDGVSSAGITVGQNVVRRCTVRCCGGTGIEALMVVDSVATLCGADGISAGNAENCIGNSTGGIGLHASFATNCYGNAVASYGLYAVTATNCHGTSKSGYGLQATAATNCSGLSESSYGLCADVALSCSGTSTSGGGLRAVKCATGCNGRSATGRYGIVVGSSTGTGSLGVAADCRGEITGTATASDSIGLFANTAENCIGTNLAGVGLQTSLSATGCTGTTATGTYGLVCGGVATNSQGSATAGTGGGLSAKLATNCFGSTIGGLYGLRVDGTANSCRGHNGGGVDAIAVLAAIAVACTAETGKVEAPSKQLGTP